MIFFFFIYIYFLSTAGHQGWRTRSYSVSPCTSVALFLCATVGLFFNVLVLFLQLIIIIVSLYLPSLTTVANLFLCVYVCVGDFKVSIAKFVPTSHEFDWEGPEGLMADDETLFYFCSLCFSDLIKGCCSVTVIQKCIFKPSLFLVWWSLILFIINSILTCHFYIFIFWSLLLLFLSGKLRTILYNAHFWGQLFISH